MPDIPATQPQRSFVASILGQQPADSLTKEDAGHIIGAFSKRNLRPPHQHELEALARALGETGPTYHVPWVSDR